MLLTSEKNEMNCNLTESIPTNQINTNQSTLLCFGSLCKKTGKYDPLEFMLECYYCHKWYHSICINITEEKALLIHQYACSVCKKKSTNNINTYVDSLKIVNNNYTILPLFSRFVITSSTGHLLPPDEEIIAYCNNKNSNLYRKLLNSNIFAKAGVRIFKYEDFDPQYFYMNGFLEPFILTYTNKLNKNPTQDERIHSISDLMELLEPQTMLYIITTSDQTINRISFYEVQQNIMNENPMNLEKDVENTIFENLATSPKVLDNIDWNILSKSFKDHNMNDFAVNNNKKIFFNYSEKNSYKDFSMNENGDGLWIQVITGQLQIFLIPPTEANLEKYFNNYTNVGIIFWPAMVDKCIKLEVSEKSLFFLPSGWIYSILTVSSCFYYYSNIVHGYDLLTQFKVRKFNRNKTRNHVPQRDELFWQFMQNYAKIISSSNMSPSKIEKNNDEHLQNSFYPNPWECFSVKKILPFLQKKIKNNYGGTIVNGLDDITDAIPDLPLWLEEPIDLIDTITYLLGNLKKPEIGGEFGLDNSNKNYYCFSKENNGYYGTDNVVSCDLFQFSNPNSSPVMDDHSNLSLFCPHSSKSNCICDQSSYKNVEWSATASNIMCDPIQKTTNDDSWCNEKSIIMNNQTNCTDNNDAIYSVTGNNNSSASLASDSGLAINNEYNIDNMGHSVDRSGDLFPPIFVSNNMLQSSSLNLENQLKSVGTFKSDDNGSNTTDSTKEVTASKINNKNKEDLLHRHRASCHRCGNLRKRIVRCHNCPHIFCQKCAEKVTSEHGRIAFFNGCPVCKELCCCGKNRSMDCSRKYHCYKKCPSTKRNIIPNPLINVPEYITSPSIKLNKKNSYNNKMENKKEKKYDLKDTIMLYNNNQYNKENNNQNQLDTTLHDIDVDLTELENLP